MRNRKRFLKWNKFRFSRTFGTAHQESRSLDEWTPVQDVQQIGENRKRSFNDWVTGLQEKETSVTISRNWYDSFGNWSQGLNDTSSRKSRSGGKKGQPEGSAVKGRSGKPRAVEPDLASGNTAGQNNSNLTSYTATAVNDGWELIQGIVPITVLYTPHIQYLYASK